MFWSYGAVILTDPGSVPVEWSFAYLGWPLELRGSPEARRFQELRDGNDLFDSTEQGMLAHRPRFVPNDKVKLPATVLMRNSFGRYRFCSKCLTYKPDRTHHCSTLGRCVLKMDHYCPWTNNTIGFYNHKFFVQFLYYAFLASFMTVTLSLPAILQRLVKEAADEQTTEFVIVILGLLGWIVCVVFSFTLLFFAGFHTYLVLRNKTTIETYEVTDPAAAVVLEAFDLGMSANWRSVFGENFWSWILPIWYGHRRGDGVFWEMNMHNRAFV
jgi:palmitoyltransferase